MYIFPLVLYRMAILPISEHWLAVFERLLFSVLWRSGRPCVRRDTCIQRLEHGGLGMPSLKCHRDAERLAFLGRTLAEEADTPWALRVGILFPDLKEYPGLEGRRRPRGESAFYRECRLALPRMLRCEKDLTCPRKTLYQGLVVGAASDRLQERLELSRKENHSLWSWAPGCDYLSNHEFSITWRVARNALYLRDVGS